MKMLELKDKSRSQLEADLVDLLKMQFGLRMQHATGQLSKNSELKRVRRDVARIKTKLAEIGGGNNE
ncbi:50S ribosomal protein L29 [Eikenella sp. S3360]|uniref:Large ribosomal subunit protein uL29 n=1 Tax=Eikenella glucosivorans TaxID=2766967 RepID=A0ABS0NCR6_9NEIS|nr:50S ribosomal protein L29 [Eikenella glucosivorans]MBH5330055.1 50S ribosomal protein L29 [Eikenella glucosivorans]